MNTTVESICPNGWTLPTYKQIELNRNIDSFTPVLGGYYDSGALSGESAFGGWWGSTAYSGGRRYRLGYNSSNSLYTLYGARRNGFYIRCVSEEKAITSLTYMQDMTFGS